MVHLDLDQEVIHLVICHYGEHVLKVLILQLSGLKLLYGSFLVRSEHSFDGFESCVFFQAGDFFEEYSRRARSCRAFTIVSKDMDLDSLTTRVTKLFKSLFQMFVILIFDLNELIYLLSCNVVGECVGIDVIFLEKVLFKKLLSLSQREVCVGDYRWLLSICPIRLSRPLCCATSRLTRGLRVDLERRVDVLCFRRGDAVFRATKQVSSGVHESNGRVWCKFFRTVLGQGTPFVLKSVLAC